MTARELAAALQALPEEYQDLQVFSVADWSVVAYVTAPMADYAIDGRPVVELS